MGGFYWHKIGDTAKTFSEEDVSAILQKFWHFNQFLFCPCKLQEATGSFWNSTKICCNNNDLNVCFVFYTTFFPHVLTIFLAPTCTNMVSYTDPYLLFVLHDVAGKFKHELILLYHCCHNNTFPGLSSTYKERCSPVWKNGERHWGPAGQKGRATNESSISVCTS